MEFSTEDGCLCGQVLYIRDTVLYHAATYPELEKAFQEAVDQYLADCEELGRDPNKPYTGSFNVRIGADRHKALASMSWKQDKSINSLVAEGVDLLINKEASTELPHV